MRHRSLVKHISNLSARMPPRLLTFQAAPVVDLYNADGLPNLRKQADALITNVGAGSKFCRGCAPPSFILTIDDAAFMMGCGIDPQIPPALMKMVRRALGRRSARRIRQCAQQPPALSLLNFALFSLNRRKYLRYQSFRMFGSGTWTRTRILSSKG